MCEHQDTHLIGCKKYVGHSLFLFFLSNVHGILLLAIQFVFGLICMVYISFKYDSGLYSSYFMGCNGKTMLEIKFDLL